MKYLTLFLLTSCLWPIYSELGWGTVTPLKKDSLTLTEVPQEKLQLTKNTKGSIRQQGHKISIQLANDIAYGLVIAHKKRHILYGTNQYRRVQTAIKLLRRGAGLDGASRRSGVTPSVLDQLMKWGQKRPGALIDDRD
jgi:hypothetical protein